MIEAVGRVRALLASDGGQLVVLERLARGGGATNWWCVHDALSFNAVWRQLRPGSAVSVYTSECVGELRYFEEGRTRAQRILGRIGEVCLGLKDADDLAIEMEFVAGPTELADFEALLGLESRVFVGEYPPRVDDGVTGVTFVVPDTDGVIRDHPH